MRIILLTNGDYAVVDDCDYEYLTRWQWSRHEAGYAVSGCAKYRRYMHREVAKRNGQDVSQTIDHRDGDKLNNQRHNLRPATYSQNCISRPRNANNKSGYKGVCWDRRWNKWRASIVVNRRQIGCGYFPNAIEAARAYNHAALLHFGEFAYLNPGV